MNDKNRVHPFLGRKRNKIRKYSMICSKPRKRHLQQSNFSKGLTKLAILPDYKCPGLSCLAFPACQKFCLILVIKFFLVEVMKKSF